MSGYCDDCGNTECICKAIAGDVVSLDWAALIRERDALRAEVAKLRAVVEAAVAVRARACAIGGGVTTVRTRDMSILGIRLDAMSALDAAKEAGNEP